MGRAPCCEKVGLKRGRWTAEEDETLMKYIQANGEGSWRSLPKNAGLLRCGKSCRLRWINYLSPNLKRGNFTTEEEDTIVKLHTSLGNRWSVMASNLPGRTDNEIKNYWNSHLRRKIYSFIGRPSNESVPRSMNVIKTVSPCKRRFGRVSRSVAKKYNNNNNTTHPLFTISRTKPSNTDSKSGGVEPTHPEKKILPGPNLGINHGRERMGFERLDNSTIGVSGSSIDSTEVFADTIMLRSEEEREEIKALGPLEELDDEIMNLGYILESGTTNDERENGVWSSNSEMGMSYACSSLMNLCFDDELVEWDWEGGGVDQGLTVAYDEGEHIMLWAWEDNDTYEVGS